MKNFIKNLISNKLLLASIVMTICLVLAIVTFAFAPFKELPFVYREF